MPLLEDKILGAVHAREYPKTCCPSEIARALTRDELAGLGCDDWRAAMDPVRRQAWDLRGRGLVEITQKGVPVRVSSLEEITGPIRLRRRHTEPESGS